MDPLRIIAETDGFFTRGQARDLGYGDREVAAAVRGGSWHRLRRGYYTFVDLWGALDDIGRHRVMCAAVLHSLGPAVALSHVSAAVIHGITVWGLALDRVHVTRLDGGAGRIEAGVAHHEGFGLGPDVVEVDGLRVMAADRAAIEAASRAPNEAALALFDSALHLRLFDPGQLASRFSQMQYWPYVRHLHVPIRMADAGGQSVGESRCRWLCWCHRIPAPVLQFEVYDATGVLRGTCDFAWPDHGLLGEFDGQVKYGRLLQPGQDAGAVVFAEKQREAELREITDFRMIRFVWSDYDRPNLTAQRLRRQLRIAA